MRGPKGNLVNINFINNRTFLELVGVGIVIPLVSLILDKENFLNIIQNYNIFKDLKFSQQR